jgi:hypothetical protein
MDSRPLRQPIGTPVVSAAIVVVMALVAACGGGASSTPAPSAAPTVAGSTPSATPPSAAPSASTAAGANAAIVGEWVGMHDCERIVSMLKAAKLDEFVAEAVVGNGLIPGVFTESELKDPAHPCDEAVQQRHSHFFTAAGVFGSKDFHAQQVDDGTWKIEGDKLVINDQAFGYAIDGDQLTLTPPTVDISTCSTKECRSTAVWVLMVAMPGTTWTKGIITP